MKKLDRSITIEPACLSDYCYKTKNWDAVTSEDKEQIRNGLFDMQGRCCAYCEGPLDVLGQHIEHFRRKSHHPYLTFQWSNLFWSCDQRDSCGHFKDHGAGVYSPNDIVNPCLEDPDHFFKFRSNGTIDIREGISAAEAHRAKETLRVFNLDQKFGRLRTMRKCAALPYIQAVDDILGLAPPDRTEFIDAEIQAAENLPFSSVIRHLFQAAI